MTQRLDAVGSLAAGSGHVSLDALLRPDVARMSLDYEQRIGTNVSAFANGWAGMSKIDGAWSPDYGAQAGLRVSW